MKIQQIYTGCLAQGAYYIESNGEAAIIDPLREVQQYVDLATGNEAKIKYIFETHFHADFVSGHINLASLTGAPIVYGPTKMETGFKAHIGKDGEEFKLGSCIIKLIHTPGHTMESSCYLLIDEHGNEKALFTGDTLFIGDVGRPDLAQHVVAELTEEKLASHLFDSLRNKIMPMPDDLIIYPAHGAGSACGKNMSDATTDTLDHQKKTNYALRADMSREEFIKEVLTGLTAPPSYFPKNVLMNIQGYEGINEVMKRGQHKLTPEEFEIVANETRALILDVRDPQNFEKGFIPNSINIGLNGSFAVWAGTLITDIKQEILLVADPGKEEEAITRLARVGYDYTIGFLSGGFEAWKNAGKEVDLLATISVDELAKIQEKQPGIAILDVRKKSEYDSEHIINAVNAPLDYVNESMIQVEKEKTTYVHCAGGYRSMIFASILKARGYDNLVNVDGGFKAIKDSGKFNITDYKEAKSML